MQYERDTLSFVGESAKDYTYSSRSSQLLREFLINKGYDSIKYLNEYEGKENDYSYAVFFSNQVKSADPVTYDNNGKVIPLSERFNESNNDIRFSRRSAPSAKTYLYKNPVEQTIIKNFHPSLVMQLTFIRYTTKWMFT